MRGKLFFQGVRIKAITFDVTGTLLQHRFPIAQTYAECAQWARWSNPPTQEEIQPCFKQAYKETLLAHPYFRHPRLVPTCVRVFLCRYICVCGYVCGVK